MVTASDAPGARLRFLSSAVFVAAFTPLPAGPLTAVIVNPPGGVTLAEPSWFGELALFESVSVKTWLVPAAAGFGSIDAVNVFFAGPAALAGTRIIASATAASTIASSPPAAKGLRRANVRASPIR